MNMEAYNNNNNNKPWNQWTDRIFQNNGFSKGTPARRKKTDVHRFSSLADLQNACAYYGCKLIENGNQYVILPIGQISIVS